MTKDNIDLPEYLIYKEHGPAPTVERVAWLGEGDFCECYLVNDTYVFRFAKHEEASAAIRRELCFLPMIQPYLTVTIPQIAFAGCEILDWYEMMGYRLIAGDVLESDALESVPAATQASLVAQMADFMRQLHTIPLDAISQCALPTLHPIAHLTTLMKQAREVVRPRIPASVWHYHEALLSRYVENPALHTYHPALLHGDLSPDHFLADTDAAQLTGVIDFGDVCIGDPAWDFIYILEDYGSAVFTEFLAYYDSENAALLAEKVRIYQQLNNVAYALSSMTEGDEAGIAEAIVILTGQAGMIGG